VKLARFAVERFRRASESFGVTLALAPPTAGRPGKINDASCKSCVLSVAYENADGKFIRS